MLAFLVRIRARPQDYVALAWYGCGIEIDEDKIDDAVLALLWLTLHSERSAWKEFDWTTTSRLYAKGLICDPVNKSKSLVLTDEGLRRSEKLFRQLFTRWRSLPSPIDRSGFAACFSCPFCSQVIDGFIELREVGGGGIKIAGAPPFDGFRMPLMRRV